MPLSEAQLKNLLKSMKGTAPTTYAAVWVQLHTADPGAAGTTAVAGESTRKEAKFTEENPLKNEAIVEWPSVSTAETFKWFSIWSASSAGTYLGKGQLETERTVAIADAAKFAVGALTCSIT